MRWRVLERLCVLSVGRKQGVIPLDNTIQPHKQLLQPPTAVPTSPRSKNGAAKHCYTPCFNNNNHPMWALLCTCNRPGCGSQTLRCHPSRAIQEPLYCTLNRSATTLRVHLLLAAPTNTSSLLLAPTDTHTRTHLLLLPHRLLPRHAYLSIVAVIQHNLIEVRVVLCCCACCCCCFCC